MSTTQAMLKIKGLQVNYGGIQAVKGIDLEVGQGELVTLIGANGAGKTTTMKAITGLKPYAAGDIEYMGQSIKGVPPHELLKRGLAMVPEGRGIFARMSIVENMQMGAYLRSDNDAEFVALARQTICQASGAHAHSSQCLCAALAAATAPASVARRTPSYPPPARPELGHTRQVGQG